MLLNHHSEVNHCFYDLLIFIVHLPISQTTPRHLTDRVSPASVKGGAGCAASEASPLADHVTPKLVGCIR